MLYPDSGVGKYRFKLTARVTWPHTWTPHMPDADGESSGGYVTISYAPRYAGQVHARLVPRHRTEATSTGGGGGLLA